MDSWEQLELFLVPTPAMLRGAQVVWCCRQCGTVVILASTLNGKRAAPNACPGCEHAGPWYRETLPVASTVAEAADDWTGTIAGFAQRS